MTATGFDCGLNSARIRFGMDGMAEKQSHVDGVVERPALFRQQVIDMLQATDRVIPATTLASITGESVSVRFGAPIPTEGRGVAHLDALSARARAALLAHGAGTSA